MGQSFGPKYGHQKLKFPEIAEIHNCGGFMVPSGSPVHQDIFIFEIGYAKMRTCNNDLNLPITSPNLNNF